MRSAVEPLSEPLTSRPAGPCNSVALVISSLGPGGAERVMSRLANHWAGWGVKVVVITFQPRTRDHFPLHPSIERVRIGTARPSAGVARALLNNREHLTRLAAQLRAAAPDVVVSFGDTINVLSVLAARRLGIPVVVSERSNPTRASMSRIWSGLRRLVYPLAATVVVQSEAVAAWAAGVVPRNRIRRIANPVEIDRPGQHEPETAAPSIVDERTVIALGRLSPEKGFDILISAFARVHDAHPGWSLVILGEGTERAALEALVRERGLEEVVRMPGTVADPAPFLRRAGMFVLSSRVEGFPNALLEAMACGLPVVAADCAYGPAEIIRPGVDGLLVEPESPEALAAAINRLIDRPQERAGMGARAVAVAEEYSVEKIMNQWDEVVGAACGRTARSAT